MTDEPDEPGDESLAGRAAGSTSTGGDAPSEAAGRVAAVAFGALLVLPILDLVQSRASAVRLAVVLPGVAAFAVIFVWRLVFVPISPVPARSTVVWLAVAAGLAVALSVGDSAHRWAPLLIFVAAVIGVRLRWPWTAAGIASAAVLAVVVLLPSSPAGKSIVIGVEALGVGAFTAGMGRLRQTIQELQEAREQLARLAVTEERLRFARDLHDLLGHSLSVIALKAELAGRLLPADADAAARQVDDINAVARGTLAEVRDAVSGYRQPTLAQAVDAGRMALDAAGIASHWEIAQVSLPSDVETVLAWAVRESVTNVIRHSRATQCWVRVSAGIVETAAEVVDDGVGGPGGAGHGDGDGDAERLPSWAGNGLAGLAERVEALHGRLDVAGQPEGGFRVRATIPTAAALTDLGR